MSEETLPTWEESESMLPEDEPSTWEKIKYGFDAMPGFTGALAEYAERNVPLGKIEVNFDDGFDVAVVLEVLKAVADEVGQGVLCRGTFADLSEDLELGFEGDGFQELLLLAGGDEKVSGDRMGQPDAVLHRGDGSGKLLREAVVQVDVFLEEAPDAPGEGLEIA